MVRGLGSVFRVVWLALALFACGGNEPTHSDFRDDGAVCLKLKDDGTVAATVFFRTCLTNCDRALPSSCTIAVEGTTLRFSSHGQSERTERDTCTEACVQLTATCATTEKVAPGAHSVVHGQDMATVVLGTRNECLFVE